MNLTDVFNPQAIAIYWDTVASNKMKYLGSAFFPARKKAGLDLKWIKGHKGLPVSLAPSNFDVKSTFRDRLGISIDETEMPYFKESMLVKERDQQEILRIQDSNDPYAQTVLDNIFNDAQTLIDGANVVPERMIMQLLSPLGGNMGINISANGLNYVYNYDPDGSWKAEHYAKIEDAADKWDAPDTCDPVRDLENAMEAQEAVSGERPTRLLMSKNTFNLMKASKKVQDGVLAQNVTANVNYTTNRIIAYLEEELNVKIIRYTKQFKNEAGIAQKFYPDNGVALLPEGTLGNTVYGTTPEERSTSMGGVNVALVNTGVAVQTTQTTDPVNIKTTCSEIVLPTFERANDIYFLEVV